MATVLELGSDKASSLAGEVMARSGQNLSACYQCRRCASGCPVGEQTGYLTPDRLIRMIVLGKRDAALDNPLIWKCVSCYTCGTRCPNDIMTARVVDTLKKMAHEHRIRPSSPKVAAFHSSFIAAAKRAGRLNELSFMGRYTMKNTLGGLARLRLRGIIQDQKDQAGFGLVLLRKGRVHFLPQKIKNRRQFKRLMRKGRAWAGSVSKSPASQE
ncbi:MAG: 4Fe-4S dicluster domain-containing protein [Deltaproteobacteria bacterium]|nr:4Fe-4S dicluster domain-containing protein [Deltaproteobacteria bacterium]MDA8306938.1 4Fe-4S dicluster domain-containing protein [Deltaproteobacteria bacterium]